MATEELQKVKKAEQAAVNRIEVAEKSAEKMLERVTEKARQKKEDDIFSVKKNLEHEKEFAEGKAREEAKGIREEGEEEVRRLKNTAERNVDKAVRHVIERVTEV